MTFGEKLRESRAISNYESGKTYPKKREVYDILAEILEVDVNYLRNENEEFITEASEKYGYRGKQQADQLVQEIGGLFAGGELSDDEMDGVMKALQDIYWECKAENREKYTPIIVDSKKFGLNFLEFAVFGKR